MLLHILHLSSSPPLPILDTTLKILSKNGLSFSIYILSFLELGKTKILFSPQNVPKTFPKPKNFEFKAFFGVGGGRFCSLLQPGWKELV